MPSEGDRVSVHIDAKVVEVYEDGSARVNADGVEFYVEEWEYQ